MNDEQSSKEEKTNHYLEQYKLLVKLQIEESNRFWTRYNVSLTLNSGLVAVFGLIVSMVIDIQTIWLPILFLCLIGMIYCAVWIFQTISGGVWQSYWISKARLIEKEEKMKYTIYDFHDEREVISKKWYGRISIIKLSLIIPMGFELLWFILLCWVCKFY